MGDHQFKPLVRFFGRSKARILTGRPFPASIAVGVNPSSERIFPRKGKILFRVEAEFSQILLSINGFDVNARLEGYVLNFVLLILDVSGDTHMKLLEWLEDRSPCRIQAG